MLKVDPKSFNICVGKHLQNVLYPITSVTQKKSATPYSVVIQANMVCDFVYLKSICKLGQLTVQKEVNNPHICLFAMLSMLFDMLERDCFETVYFYWSLICQASLLLGQAKVTLKRDRNQLIGTGSSDALHHFWFLVQACLSLSLGTSPYDRTETNLCYAGPLRRHSGWWKMASQYEGGQEWGFQSLGVMSI